MASRSQVWLDWVSAIQRRCTAAGHRHLVVLAGTRDWGRAWADEAIEVLGGRGLRFGQGVDATPLAEARRFLGQECAWLLCDLHAGLHVEGLAIATGTLRGGGLLFLLTPPVDAWATFRDPDNRRITPPPYVLTDCGSRFWERMAGSLSAPGCSVVTEGESLPNSVVVPDPPVSAGECVHPYATADQQRAVVAIRHVVEGHRRRPLLLLADRGRGKSAALGLAAAELLRRGCSPILVTAPAPATVDVVFTHAERLLDGSERHGNQLSWQGAVLQYLPPDEVVAHKPEARMLLVDEAAAIPLPMQAEILRHYSRLVFSSTVHGYEGTGRGFSLRFRAMLDRLTPQWRELEIAEPVRWSADDPLEAWLNNALLLDAEPAPAEVMAGDDAERCGIKPFEPSRLIRDEQTLRELFGLLVTAHYQTSPQDLRQLLDGPGQRLWLIHCRDHVAGVALVSEEGGLSVELARSIHLGERRLRGHLLAQSLTFHLGMADAATRRGWRIVRIAIHPALRRQGLATRLLATIAEQAAAEEVDYLGASFAADAELADFWLGAGYCPARVGLNSDAASAAHSLFVVRPLTPAGRGLAEEAVQRIRRDLPIQLTEPLRELDPQLVVRLLGGTAGGELDEFDRADLHAFIHGGRGYEVSIAALEHLLHDWLAHPHWREGLAIADWPLAVEKVLQRRPWPEVVARFALTGRGAAVARLREVIGAIYAWLAASTSSTN